VLKLPPVLYDTSQKSVLDPIPEPDSYEKFLRSTQCQDQNWYEKLEEVPDGRTKTGMKSLKKYPMAGPKLV
jgi:hypothetical protein